MAHDLFSRRIETDRLVIERASRETLDPFEFYEFVTRDDWRGDATEHIPWFRFDRLDQVADFLDHCDDQWADRERAQYVLRSKEEEEEENEEEKEKEKEDGEIVGLTAYVPEWETRRAWSGIALAKHYWGREYGLERVSAFVELTFERYDLDAYYTTCGRNTR
jgi:RimJ/RimL family protein N-acetyltransferase